MTNGDSVMTERRDFAMATQLVSDALNDCLTFSERHQVRLDIAAALEQARADGRQKRDAEVSQMRELEAENAKLRAMNEHLVNRVAACAEVLGKVASKMPVCRCDLHKAADYPTVDEAIVAARYLATCLGGASRYSCNSCHEEIELMRSNVCNRWPWVEPGEQ